MVSNKKKLAWVTCYSKAIYAGVNLEATHPRLKKKTWLQRTRDITLGKKILAAMFNLYGFSRLPLFLLLLLRVSTFSSLADVVVFFGSPAAVMISGPPRSNFWFLATRLTRLRAVSIIEVSGRK